MSRVRGTMVVLPGAHCAPDRYGWLARALGGDGWKVDIVDVPVVWQPTLFSSVPVPTRFVNSGQLRQALDSAADPCVVIGHSMGGSVLLEALDAAALDSLQRQRRLRAAIALGAHLQPWFRDRPIPGRNVDSELRLPPDLELLLIAAEHDDMAPPAHVCATAARYRAVVPGAVRYHMLAGGNHLQWTDGTGTLDRPDFDGVASVSRELQQAQTVAVISEFLESLHPWAPT